jgi:hypothetical protein
MEGTSARAQLARVLQLLRRSVYSTPIELAAALGVSGELVRRWEAGESAPTRAQTACLWAWCNRHDVFQTSTIVLDGHLISQDEFQGLMVAARQVV